MKGNSEMEKKLFIAPEDIKKLTTLKGQCFASDKIMVEGKQIGYMYRERAQFRNDSGWRFLAGDEDAAYLANPENIGVYDMNTVANYDEAILPLLKVSRGTAFIRNKKGALVEDFAYEDDSPQKYFPVEKEDEEEEEKTEEEKVAVAPVKSTAEIRVEGASVAKLDETQRAALMEYYKNSIGEISYTIRDDEPEDVSVDVVVIPPSNGHDFYTLATVGMSAADMTVAEGSDAPKRVELMIMLPSQWPLDKNERGGAKQGFAWPFAWLRKIGHIPFRYKSALNVGRIVPNGAPAKPIMQSSGVCGIALDKLRVMDVKEFTLPGEGENKVQFLCLVPVFQAEMDLKAKLGADAMFAKMYETEFKQVVDPKRKSAVGFSIGSIFGK